MGKKRYGVEEKGLLAVFLDVYNTLPGHGSPSSSLRNSASPRSQAGNHYHSPSNKAQLSITSFKDVLTGDKKDNSAPPPSSGNRSPSSRNSTPLSATPSHLKLSPRRKQQNGRCQTEKEVQAPLETQEAPAKTSM